VKSPVELAALGQGNRLIVELLVEFEVLLKKLPKWYDKIWFRYIQHLSYLLQLYVCVVRAVSVVSAVRAVCSVCFVRVSCGDELTHNGDRRRRQRIVTSVSLDIVNQWLRKCGVTSTPSAELKGLRRERMRAERRTARDHLLSEFVRPASGVAPGMPHSGLCGN
jgi:hypothetical protein